MNTSLRRVAVTIMVLIVLLLANATITQVFTADGLRADPRNQRVLLDEYSRQRTLQPITGFSSIANTSASSAGCNRRRSSWRTSRASSPRGSRIP